jgi:hypothetical protein
MNMSTEFLSADIWKVLTAEARRFSGKSFVAVAYFGTGAAKRLPLKKGSILVVDASEKAVKSGQTNPTELIKLRGRGVRIFSMPNLHAKVFVLGGVAFVGSTNVSENSEDLYSEASIRSRQTSVVSSARQFVRTLAVNELGPQKLDLLLRIYKSRKKTGSGPKARRSKIEPRFFIVRLGVADEPIEDEAIIEDGIKKARKLMALNKTHKEMYFWGWPKKSFYRPGDTVLAVQIDSKRKSVHVEPPAEFLYTNMGKKKRYHYFEQPRRSGLSASEFRKKMPSRLKKRIDRSGKINKEDELVIRRAFIGK